MNPPLTCPTKTDPQVMLEWWIKRGQGDEQEAVYPGAESPRSKLLLAASIDALLKIISKGFTMKIIHSTYWNL
jgi:hypothetical protein